MTWRITNRILFFFDEKTFTVNPVLNKQNDPVVTLGNDISENWTPRSVNQTSSLNHADSRRSIEQRDDASGLVWTGLQDNLWRLQRSYGDESSSMGQEDP